MASSARSTFHRYASVDSRSSSDRRGSGNNLSYIRRLISNSNGIREAADPISAAPATENSSRALVKQRGAKSGHNIGSMVKKLMEKRNNPKLGSADRVALMVPANMIAEDLKGPKGSHLSALSRKQWSGFTMFLN